MAGEGLDSRKALVEHLGIGGMREGGGDYVSFTIFLDLLLAMFLALPEEEACFCYLNVPSICYVTGWWSMCALFPRMSQLLFSDFSGC